MEFQSCVEIVEKLNLNFWKNKKVLVTGSKGFKGSWLCFLLNEIGCKVHGIGNNTSKNDSLFKLAKIDKFVKNRSIDLNDKNKVLKYINKINPDIIFHLAAKPIVSESIIEPYPTLINNFATTLNILEAFRLSNSKILINITSDKCYENIGKKISYKEDDKLGGKDPYSASKATCEIISNSYLNTYFLNSKNKGLATARAGNVIGGLDWSQKRLIPDLVNAVKYKKIVKIRNIKSIRPWQFILDPLYGYLLLAQNLYKKPDKFSGAWNFGPSKKNSITVNEIINITNQYFDNKLKIKTNKNIYKEEKILMLNSYKAKKNLNWKPKYSIQKSLEKTYEVYMQSINKKDIINIVKQQIVEYLSY